MSTLQRFYYVRMLILLLIAICPLVVFALFLAWHYLDTWHTLLLMMGVLIAEATILLAYIRQWFQHDRLLARYRLLVTTTKEIVLFVRATDGRILEANNAAILAYGYPLAQLTRMKIQDLRAIETRTAISQQMQTADQNGIVFETVHQRSDGSQFPVEVHSVGDSIGNERVLLSLIYDISTRKVLEASLEQKRQSLHLEVATANTQLHEYTLRLHLLNNIALNIMSGVPEDEIIARTVVQVAQSFPELRVAYSTISDEGCLTVCYACQPEGMPNLSGLKASLTAAADYLSALRSGEMIVIDDVRHDMRIAALANGLMSSGTCALLDVPLLYGNELVGLLCFDAPTPHTWSEHETTTLAEVADYLVITLMNARAVHARIEAEEALRESEHRWHLALEASNDGLWDLNYQTGECFYSDRWQTMLGYTPGEVVGHAGFWQQSIHPDDMLRVTEAVNAHMNGHTLNYECTYRCRSKTGEWLWILGRGKIVSRDATGLPLRVVGTHTDVTAQYAMQEELLAAKEAAENAACAQAAFLAAMSHEIRTPMNGVIGMTGLLLDTPLTSEQHEYTETIRRSSEALLSIINDILDFSKIEAGKLELEELDFDVHQMIEDVLDLLAEPAERKCLQLGSLIAHNVPNWLRGDPGRLRQILTNLVGNAVKFTPQGEVIVRVDLAESSADSIMLRVAVSDTGIGIAPEVQPHLFRPFTQADSSTTRLYGGTGLGLAICQQLVTLMGGSIQLQSVPNQGTTFTFTVQLRPSSSDPLISYDDLKGVKVLIVDDSMISCVQLTQTVSGWGMIPTAVGDGASALAILQASVASGSPFAVLIVDIVLPDQDGFALTRAIAADSLLAKIPVILISAFSLRGYAQEARAAGAAHFLTKPIHRSQLFDSLIIVLGLAKTDIISQYKPPANPTLRRNGRILVVEDNAINQRVVTRSLEKLGLRADVAANGREALIATAQINYDLVLMDCHMPELDGFEATAAIRAHEGTSRHTVIVALTANVLPSERERCLNAGMDDYLAKPVTRDQLVATLARWLSADPPTVPTSEPVTLPTPTAIDRNALSAILGAPPEADPVLLSELIDLFFVETPLSVAILNAGVVAGETEVVCAQAHLLKGACSNLGLIPLHACCLKLEQYAKASDQAGIQEAYAAFSIAYQDAIVELEQLQSTLKPT